MRAGGYNWACFKAQQAAEIALKAVLVLIGQHKFTHSTLALVKTLEASGIAVDGDVEDCARFLDTLYIPTRYPDAWPEGEPSTYYTERDALQAIDCARRILEKAEAIVHGARSASGAA